MHNLIFVHREFINSVSTLLYLVSTSISYLVAEVKAILQSSGIVSLVLLFLQLFVVVIYGM